MLVDLARNDVGRVVRFGTEQVDEMMVLERYSHVMHLTSQVSGDLREGLGPVDVLRATLPAGTVSGAPKVRAMEIIDELEPTKRCGYAGVIGYLDFSGNLDTAIRDPHDVHRPERRVRTGGRRDRRRQRSRSGRRGVLEQGEGASRRGARGSPDERAACLSCSGCRSSGTSFGSPGRTRRPTSRVSSARTSTWCGREARRGRSCFNRRGRWTSWLRVTADGVDSFVLDVDGGYGEAVVTRLNRFKLRVRVEITPVDWQCVAVRGDGASAIAGIDAEWPGIEAVDAVGPDAVDVVGREGALEDYERARIEAGVPAMGREITSATIPAELGVTERSVSFTKGCYTGQELVARVDSRGGNVPRHLRRLRVEGDRGRGIPGGAPRTRRRRRSQALPRPIAARSRWRSSHAPSFLRPT